MKGWWWFLGRYAHPRRLDLAQLLALMLGGVALDVLKPWPLKLLIDHVLGAQPFPPMLSARIPLLASSPPAMLVIWLAAATVVLFLVSELLRVAQQYVQTGAGNRMVYNLGAALFEHLQYLSLRFHSQHQVGDLVRRVTTDSSCYRDLVLNVALPLLTSLANLLAMFTVMWQLDRSLSLLALAIMPLLAGFIALFVRPMAERTYQQQQLEGETMALAEQTLTALPVVQAFNREAHEDQRFQMLAQRTLRATLRALSTQLQFKVSVNGTTALGSAVVMVVGGLHVLQGTLSVGSLLIILTYLAALYAPLVTLAYLSSGFAAAAARARRVLEVLQHDDLVVEMSNAQPLPPRPAAQRGQLQFEQVTFGYQPGHPVLHDLSFAVQPGEVVALVGRSGAGKSTLAALLPRLYDPWHGSVLVDGVDVRNLQLASLRAHIGLALQEPFLLPVSIADNIAYGRPAATRNEIVAAAVAAQADAFIQRLPQGYDTLLGERGAKLSGGQRQQVALARLFLKDAPVLILDEPSAALDAETEQQLMAALERLMAGRTTLIIAHRRSTIQRADRILVLEQGRLVESGTPAQLQAANGQYTRLYDQPLESVNT